MVVNDVGFARQPDHVADVSRFLRERGALKVKLRFKDDTSRYLHDMILGLHEHHGHGLPITHSASRGWFWDVRPNSTIFQSQMVQARSETMQNFPWHTDCSYEGSPPRFFALQVLQPDRRGGGTLSVMNVKRLLSLLSPSTTASLLKPEYLITVPSEFCKNETQRHIIGSILAADECSHQPSMVRFREDLLTPLSAGACAALQELKQRLLGSDAQKEIIHLTPEALPQGSILLLDNRQWLHARNEVKDPERHLRRVRWDARPFQALCD